MNSEQLRSTVLDILTSTQPLQNIVQNLSKSEVEEVLSLLDDIGYSLVKKNIENLEKAKPLNYKISGVKSTGYLPEGHPERQLVIDHINKLLTLPQDHPHRQIGVNIARALQERHLTGPKVIPDTQPKISIPGAKIPGELHYDEMKPSRPKEGPSYDYSKINEVKTQDPAATIDYTTGAPITTVHNPKK